MTWTNSLKNNFKKRSQDDIENISTMYQRNCILCQKPSHKETKSTWFHWYTLSIIKGKNNSNATQILSENKEEEYFFTHFVRPA